MVHRRFALPVGRGVRLGAAMAVLAILALAAVVEEAGAHGRCGTVQARVDNVAAGGTVDLPDHCVFRETVAIKKPLTLRGGPGVEIRGSNIWTNWKKSGRYWVRGRVPRFEALKRISDPQHPHPCKGKNKRCLWPAQVFFDGRPLEQVASAPGSGQFAVNADRKVLLANDPRGHRVEVTVREQWVVGRAGNVTVEGFTMKHAAVATQSAAINNNGYANWTVRNNDLSWAHGVNLALSQAGGLKIIGNKIHHAGRLGIASNKAGVVMKGNEIHDNNTEAYYPGWSAGGVKASSAWRLLLEANKVHGNDWNGIWVDGGSEDVVIAGNRVHHNRKKGIQFEISDRGRISDNVVWENGWGEKEGGGMHVIASRSVEVEGNIVAWNRGRHIFVQNANRSHGNGTEFDLVKNVRVHHNTVLAPAASGYNFALDWRKSYAAGNIYNPDAGNRGYSNRYWYEGPESSGRYRFYWKDNLEKLGAFNRTLGEEQGRYMTVEEKNRVANAHGLSSNPKRR